MLHYEKVVEYWYFNTFFNIRKKNSMKKLDQLRQESKEIKDKIEDTVERLRQLKKPRKNVKGQER